jgi:hypothetical protein
MSATVRHCTRCGSELRTTAGPCDACGARQDAVPLSSIGRSQMLRLSSSSQRPPPSRPGDPKPGPKTA